MATEDKLARLNADIALLKEHCQALWMQCQESPEYKEWHEEYTNFWQRKGGLYGKAQDLFKVYEASAHRQAYQKALQDLFELQRVAKQREMWI